MGYNNAIEALYYFISHLELGLFFHLSTPIIKSVLHEST